MRSTVAVIPVKPLDQAKQRLASVLDGNMRGKLCLAMLEDIIYALKKVPELMGIIIVSNDIHVKKLAKKYNIEVIQENPNSNLNKAVEQASHCLFKRRIDQMLYLPGDIPLVTPSAIKQILINNEQHSSLVLVPCEEHKGTNALLCRPSDCFPFSFGNNSYRLHQQHAKKLGIPIYRFESKKIALDIDTPAALKKLKNKLEIDSSLAPNTAKIMTHLSAKQNIYQLAEKKDLKLLMKQAARLRDEGHGQNISFSKKVFIPLTQLCRDVCHYCTFAQTPRRLQAPYLGLEQIVSLAKTGAEYGCKEALFTLGDKPEARYRVAKEWLTEHGYDSTLDYLEHAAREVFEKTGLLPHLNPGLMTKQEMARLKNVSASMGIMLESTSARLCEKGQAHYGSPDKDPEKRLETIRIAGELNIPFTTGILIGIGETRHERIESLLHIHQLHQQFGHIQEIIIQNFRAKADTKMATFPEPSLDELLWTISIARIIFGSSMNIQAPPNLSPDELSQLINAGINDWGGVSPLTPDHVNPEAPWPHLDKLKSETQNAGKTLVERLGIYPQYILSDLVSKPEAKSPWMEGPIAKKVFNDVTGDGLVRTDQWLAGTSTHPPQEDIKRIRAISHRLPSARLNSILKKATNGGSLSKQEIVYLLNGRENEFTHICQTADALRKQTVGSQVSYVINRNINYTNICTYKCQFCAFSKGKGSENLRGTPYNLNTDEIITKAREAKSKGASEVCLQGGIHPSYTGQTYIDICKAIRTAEPELHIHAFSPLEIWQGAQTSSLPLDTYLAQLKDAGLDTLPGTAAEILHDNVRRTLCPDKISSAQWLQVMETAHTLGFKSTATIMFGHIESYEHIANHLIAIRNLQEHSQGFTEFVPLPFVHNYAPLFKKGLSRPGPSFREAILIHAVARLVFHKRIDNIQASWTKLGHQGAKAALLAGANDLGGTLMSESITRAAGASHGQESSEKTLVKLIEEVDRVPQQRTTRYDWIKTTIDSQPYPQGQHHCHPV